MISLLVLVCSTLRSDCRSFTPEMVFDNYSQCNAAAFILAETIKDEPAFYIEDFQCVVWGDPA